MKKSWKDIPVLNWLMYVLRFATHPDDIQAGMQVLMDKGSEKNAQKESRRHYKESQDREI